MDWDSFHVLSVVVHYLPSEKDDPGADLQLTDEEIPLDGQLKSYFENKVSSRLAKNGLEVVADEGGDATVRESVAAVLNDPTQLTDASKDVAKHLFEIQNKTNSSGLLAVVHGATEQGTCVAMVKLERERGIHFSIKEVDGKNIVDLELLRDLTLTDKTKVYKTALLTCPLNKPSALTGFVADDQRTSRVGARVASFFLGDFLGCKPKVPAAKMTFDFVAAANKAINEDIPSPEKRGRYQIALLAMMQDNSTDIRPKAFASKHIDAEDRPKFLERVSNTGLDPNVTFTKDTSLIRVSQFRMTFESGMVLVGDKDALTNNVKLPETNGTSSVVLEDSIDTLVTGR